MRPRARRCAALRSPCRPPHIPTAAAGHIHRRTRRPVVAAVVAAARSLHQAEAAAREEEAASGRTRLQEAAGAAVVAAVPQTLDASSKLRMIHASIASE